MLPEWIATPAILVLVGVASAADLRRREYVQLAGVSERTAARDLTDLVEKNLLELSGGRGRSTAYRLQGHGGA